MPSFPSTEPTVSYFDDLDYSKYFKKEFTAIIYNDALTSKLDLLTEPTVSPQHIDEFNLNDETSLFECDEEEQNVLYFNDLFPFNVIYPDDSKSDKDNDDVKIDIKQSLGVISAKTQFRRVFVVSQAIIYNDALTYKLDLLTEPTVSPQHIDEFNLNDETLLFECDEEEQNVLYFNDLFPFNVIYPDDSKSDKDNDDVKIDIKQSLGVIAILLAVALLFFRQWQLSSGSGTSSVSGNFITGDKEMELWVELKRLYEPDVEDQLWTHTQHHMHAPVEWKLYDMCRVHQVTSKDKEIFMLVEKDYPLRKGLAILMISYKLQVENYSRMANDLILKIYNNASTPSQQGD
nr:hypothetical protein [Tanacetum cinerariifolium]